MAIKIYMYLLEIYHKIDDYRLSYGKGGQMTVRDLIKQLQELQADDAELEVIVFDESESMTFLGVEGIGLRDPKFRGYNPTPEGEHLVSIYAGNVPLPMRAPR